MSEPTRINSSSEITSEACAWIAQLESGDLSSADLAALREWMGRSARHAQEIREIADLSGQLSILTEMAAPLEEAAVVQNGLRKPQWRRGFGAPAFAVLSACVVVLGLITVFLVVRPASQSPSVYETAIGEYRSIELADGSTVKLNTDSRIEVDFKGEKRQIRLVNGEALFDVASNPSRPFIVYSGEAVAEAVGTSFVVRLRDAVTELAVVEGVVAFSKLSKAVAEQISFSGDRQHDDSASLEPEIERTIIVKAGQALAFSAIPEETEGADPLVLSMIDTREIQRKLSWTEGLFDFSQTPLEEVVFEISRHNSVQIEILDDNLKQLKFGGMFRTGDVDALLEALEGLGVSVEYAGNNRILLRKADNS